MTTGSESMYNDAARRYREIIWSGTDRPRTQYPKRRRVIVYRAYPVRKKIFFPYKGKQKLRKRKDKLRRMRSYRHVQRSYVELSYLPARQVIDKPPKRVREAPNPFTKTWSLGYAGDIQPHVNSFGAVQDLTFLNLGFTVPGVCSVAHADGTPVNTTLLDSNDTLRMIGKFREKLYGSDFNMSVFLGEGVKSLELITDSATRIYDAYRQIRRGDIAGAALSLTRGTERSARRHSFRRGASDTLATNWLQLQYGWLPLLKDTKGAAESLAHALHVPFSQRYSVRSRKEKVSTKTYGSDTPQDRRSYAKWKTVDRLRWTLYIKESPSLAYQLGLMDPEIVAWELTPFSFVADWFLPIGQYLEARAAVSAIKGEFVVSRKTEGMFVSGTSLGFPFGTGGAKWRQGRFDRTIVTAAATKAQLPLPKVKPWNKIASWQHCTNALALLQALTSPSGARGLKGVRL